MLQFGTFLLYALITSTAAAPRRFYHDEDHYGKYVLLDTNGCVHLKCHIGQFCSDGSTTEELEGFGISSVEFRRRKESKFDFLERIKREYPTNTFTIGNDPLPRTTRCTVEALFCNRAHKITTEQFKKFQRNFNRYPQDVMMRSLVCGDMDDSASHGMLNIGILGKNPEKQ